MIRIYEPYKIDPEPVAKVLLENRLTSLNKEVFDVSSILSSLHIGSNVVPVFNGTCATHMLLKALKHKVKNLKKIIVPNNVYVAAWNCLLMDGDDIELIPIDADDDTWCIDTKKLISVANSNGPDDTGILVVHNVGNIVNVPKLKSVLPDHQFIEDNCEGFLGEYEGRPTGTSSLASSISFYANKTLTCGEGGAFISNDEYLSSFVSRLVNQGQTNERYVHDILAYNYRMTNMQAALLLSQLSLREEIQQKKSDIFKFYKENLSNKFSFQKITEGTKHSEWMFSARLKGCDYKKDIEKQCISLFETRPMFYQMSAHRHLLKYSKQDDENVARSLAKECFMLPSHPNLSKNDLEVIVHTMNRIVD